MNDAIYAIVALVVLAGIVIGVVWLLRQKNARQRSETTLRALGMELNHSFSSDPTTGVRVEDAKSEAGGLTAVDHTGRGAHVARIETKKDIQVSSKLAAASLTRGALSEAAAFAKVAVNVKPQWIVAQILWASAVVQDAARGATLKVLSADDVEQLKQALAKLEAIISQVRYAIDSRELADLYLKLGAGHRLLGNEAAGEEAIREANRVAPSDEDVALRGVLDHFSHSTVRPEGLIALAAALVKAAWSHPVLGFQAPQLTQRVLDRLGVRSDGRQLVSTLLSLSDSIFGLDVMAAEHFKGAVRQWLRFHQ